MTTETMGHDHHHVHDDSGSIGFAFILNLVFAIIEFIGGIYTNSLAIMADAIHDLGDSVALGSAWLLERLSLKRGDRFFTYGYRRFSLLGAVISAGVIIAGSVFILFKAVPRLFSPELPHAPGMLALAVAGIVVNGAAVLRLRGASGMNARMVAWHLMEDVLGWAAVLAVSVVLLFRDIPVLDPLLSIIITAYILANVLRNLGKTLGIFLQGVPANTDIEGIERDLRACAHVLGTHHTHVWSMDGTRHVLTTHVVVDSCATREDILQLKERFRAILAKHGMSHSTVEIEYSDEECRIGDDTCGSDARSCRAVPGDRDKRS
ncbi:MAG TPA: cation diffusion facilitator family transporter [Deltaproteobacteria bacterium]|nr:cation diffusion facilitator family transporter [Deltaproteobacteria bacterium]HOA43585.1 cation diffusion facilitator family transporter [Deltaproteobacteria bacterium]HOC74972.1 cation diffusion facilitator family transporter [Deltaproteobacteria bacterium]HOG83164.1 cation diffusion facilitator family transporter [Deltaproteobacteria bacterium]HPA74669.1 cation diffusion facilitator family transporter [Deltaproteobacteria bacterium]